MRVHKPGLPVYWTGRPFLTTAALAAHSPVTVYAKLLRQLAAQLAAAHITAPAHADLNPQLAGAITQDRFHLGIAPKDFRHARHPLATTPAARPVPGAPTPVAVLSERFPACQEPIGGQMWR